MAEGSTSSLQKQHFLPSSMTEWSWRVAAAVPSSGLVTAGKTKQLLRQQWAFVKRTQPNKTRENRDDCIGEGASERAAAELMRRTVGTAAN